MSANGLFTYNQHYEACKKAYKGETDTSFFSSQHSAYEVTLDQNILGDVSNNKDYKSLIEMISQNIQHKFDNDIDTQDSELYTLLENCGENSQINELANQIMPLIEQRVFHSYLKVESLQIYKNKVGALP